jgi:hypothetical protein
MAVADANPGSPGQEHDSGSEYGEVLLEEHDCPIEKVHRRLEQAHQLWHDAESRYFDPETFPTYLNSCIQALRSVSWVLQKHKNAFADFDTWYGMKDKDGEWQARMRADAVMVWLVQARNRIEKQGDLEGKSTALISFVDSYLEAPQLELQLPVTYSSEQMGRELIKRLGPLKPEAKDASIVIERRWVEDELPDYEILDALSHAYGVLNELVADAHRKLGLPEMMVFSATEGITPRIPFHGGRLPCMVATDEPRSTTLTLSDGDILTIRKHEKQTDAEDMKKAVAHYGDEVLALSEAVRNAPSLGERAGAYFEHAKHLLKKDGFHQTIALLYRDSQVVRILSLRAQDQREKYLIWRDVSREVETTGATSIMTIGEVWNAPFDPEHPLRRAADSTEKTEALQLVGQSIEGETVALSCAFTRDEHGAILLGKNEEMNFVDIGFTRPIQRIWSKWRKQQGVDSAPE